MGRSKKSVSSGSENEPDSFIELQNVLRKRLTACGKGEELIGCKQQHDTLLKLLTRTSLEGESSSALLIGPRGSGKSMVLNSVLEKLNSDQDLVQNMLFVRLNGLLQTDDRLAIKEITKQLQLENVVGDKVFGSFAENLTFLLNSLKTGTQETKCIVVILDEFDLFCHHTNQGLLYNLFDMALLGHTPLAIIGLTVRMDVVELLDKRVKSRFSHRQLFILNSFTFDEYVDVTKTLLKLDRQFSGSSAFQTSWDTNVEDIFELSSVTNLLKNMYNVNKSIRDMKVMLLLAVNKISREHSQLTSADLVEAQRQLAQDAKVCTLLGLSILELSLVVAMHRLNITYDREPITFEMVNAEYNKLVQSKSTMRCYEKAVALKAFEHLQALELVLPCDGSRCNYNVTSSKLQKEYQLMTLLVEPYQLHDAIQRYQGLPTELQHWAMNMVN